MRENRVWAKRKICAKKLKLIFSEKFKFSEFKALPSHTWDLQTLDYKSIRDSSIEASSNIVGECWNIPLNPSMKILFLLHKQIPSTAFSYTLKRKINNFAGWWVRRCLYEFLEEDTLHNSKRNVAIFALVSNSLIGELPLFFSSFLLSLRASLEALELDNR